MPFLLEAYQSKLAGDINQLSKTIEAGATSSKKIERCDKERDRLAEEYLRVGLYRGIKTTLGGTI